MRKKIAFLSKGHDCDNRVRNMIDASPASQAVYGFVTATNFLTGRHRQTCAFLPSIALRREATATHSQARRGSRRAKLVCQGSESTEEEDDVVDLNDAFYMSGEKAGKGSMQDEGEGEAKSEPAIDYAERMLQALREITDRESALCNPNPEGLQMSHSVVQFDDDGQHPRDRYVYVVEQDCIGCTQCATTATNTFMMEDEFGRARAFDQEGDGEDLVEVAIDTCPVNCIYYVSWKDLVQLELDRREQVINNWARLVGGQDITSSRHRKGSLTVLDSSIIRCEDCPGRGCKTCPMYGVGENPEYVRKVKERQAIARKKSLGAKRKRRLL